MAERWRPHGYPQVSAYLICPGAQDVIDFLEAALDARALRRYETADGSIMHAEVRIGDAVVMMGESSQEWPATATHLHVYVPDVDEAFRRALAAGAAVVAEPSQRAGDPDRRGGVRDRAGNTWWLATQRSAG